MLTLLLGVSISPAATFEVTSTADTHDVSPADGLAQDNTGETTLRAAVEEANALAGSDTIVVSVDVSPIKLTLGAITIEDNYTAIIGTGGAVVDGIINSLGTDLIVFAGDSCSIEGFTLRRSRRHAIRITGSYNRIGGETESERVVFTANGLGHTEAAAVAIVGADALGNSVVGCYIGMYGNGTLVDGNANGVWIGQGAHENIIGGGNLISGNSSYGVIITGGAYDNQVTADTIGPNSTGDAGPGNGLSGVFVSDGAYNNLIGGDSLTEGNHISANVGNGIELRGSDVYANTINGNFIGTDRSGKLYLSNGADGVLVADGAHDNLIGGSSAYSGNLISGNAGSGVHLSGAATYGNQLTANYIGTDIRGYIPISNGTVDGDGVLIDGGSHNNQIGGQGEFEFNLISGNYAGTGVHIDGPGSDNNLIIGNLIGLISLGNSSAYNANGVAISGGARRNIIGGTSEADRNYISGNRADLFPSGAGVLIQNPGTDYNQVLGNYIGLDVVGSRALRNGSAGVIIGDGSRFNVIGGDSPEARNVISGNGALDPVPGHAAGVHLYGQETSYNRVIGNVIGKSGDGLSFIPNAGHGIGLYAGANDNRIGGNTADSGNTIVASESFGVFISGAVTRENLIRNNAILQNDSLGIRLVNGAQDNILPPALNDVPFYLPAIVSGNGAPPGGIVDIYLAPTGSTGGEAENLLFSITADSAGEFSQTSMDLAAGDIITAIAVDSNNNSSALAAPVTVGTATAVHDDPQALPLAYSLEQNYPNPFNPSTSIRFSLGQRSPVNLTIYNTLGRRVTTLVDEQLPAGEHLAQWDGTDASGHTVASGLYLYRLDAGEFTEGRKMLLVK